MTDQSKQMFGELVGELDAGIFEGKATAALREVAQGVNYTRRPGKVTLTFDIKPIGDSSQVHVAHTVSYSKPMPKGRITEDDTTHTPMYVGRNGVMSIYPDTQQKLPLGDMPRSADA